MNRSNRRIPPSFRPEGEPCEGRLLLSVAAARTGVVHIAGYEHPIRPNTPVLPYAADFKVATFIDPTVRILQGNRIAIAKQVLVAPYATLDGRAGFITIGAGSSILDNAAILANPGRQPGLIGVQVGDDVVVGNGAVLRGPSIVGATGPAAKPTLIGPNALIDGATIAPGAIVSALARVGPGVTVPAGFRVLPGANVTSDAEASDPALGKVVPVTASDTSNVQKMLSNDQALATGYATLYQGNKATGASPGTTNPAIFNGDLATVEGSSQEPGSSVVKFEPAAVGPKFLHRAGQLVQGLFPQLRARIIGGVVFDDRPANVAHRLGRSDSIRADEGQPIAIKSIAAIGDAVTIRSPLGGLVSGSTTVTNGHINIGRNFVAQDGAVILGGPTATTNLGDGVTIGPGAVVSESTIGSAATIGARSYISGSTVPAGAVIAPGTILINNKVVGTVQW